MDGKVILITGGSGFLASQFIPHLQNEGAIIEVLDLKSDSPVDITDPESVKPAVDAFIDRHGRIDSLVHAAAIDAVPAANGEISPQWAPYDKFSPRLWRKEIDVNLTGAQITTQAVAPHLMRANTGSVVFIASDLALIAPNNSIYDEGRFKDIAYVASKAGMLGLMRAWAAYLGPYNVRVNALIPGGMYNGHSQEFAEKNGKLNMLGRMSRPGEYNGLVQFLLSGASSYMTGSCLIADGGRTAI